MLKSDKILILYLFFQIEIDFKKLYPGAESKLTSTIDTFCNGKILKVFGTNITEIFSKKILNDLKKEENNKLSQGSKYLLFFYQIQILIIFQI